MGEGDRRGKRVRVMEVSGPCVVGGEASSWVSLRPVQGGGIPLRYATGRCPGNPLTGTGERRDFPLRGRCPLQDAIAGRWAVIRLFNVPLHF